MGFNIRTAWFSVTGLTVLLLICTHLKIRRINLELANSPETQCDAWTLEWYARKAYEERYVPEQVLSKVNFTNSWPRGPHDCAIIVVRKFDSSETLELIEKYRGKMFAVIAVGVEHVSCEGEIPTAIIKASPLVIRNYYYASCEDFKNVLTVPLGIRDGAIVDTVRPPSNRSYKWVFSSGYAVEYRKRFASAFDSIDSHFISWKEDDQYREHLCDGVFALCPRGGREDTWRLMEALNCGAIPIVSDGGEYFSKFMDPKLVDMFITASTLNATHPEETSLLTAAAKAEEMLKDMEMLDLYSRNLNDQFRKYQNKWQQDVANRIQAIAM